MKEQRALTQLLGVYYFSESEIYFKFKSLLTKGITFKFSADKLKPNSHALDYLEILIMNLHEHSLDVINNYGELLEYNYKMLLFSDETIEIFDGKNKFKINLQDYLKYQINRANFREKVEPIEHNYEIFIKLTKEGESRKKVEELLNQPQEIAKGACESILQEMKRTLNSSYFKSYPKRYKTFLNRLHLWGQKTKDLTKEDVKVIVENLSPQDFGQKDIVFLYYLKLFFSRHNLSNTQMFNLIKKTLSGRKNNQNKLIKKYDKG